MSALIVILRGGGDLASGVALRLFRAGLRLIITELEKPLMVRRAVAFAEAVYDGRVTVEGIAASRIDHLSASWQLLDAGVIPVIVDPQLGFLDELRRTHPDSPLVIVDARMLKKSPELDRSAADLVIGLGPGFTAGENCHAVVETNRGHRLGRVLWHGSPQADTGLPDQVMGRASERVLRAPADGVLQAFAAIGDRMEAGQLVAQVASSPVYAPFDGVLRGLIHPGLWVSQGMKIGDVDPRDDPRYCFLVSDKSLAIGGGVLEAILSRRELRPFLWESNAPG